MAHGLPDWYRGVDIAYQALAMLITRPTYGGAIASQGSSAMIANQIQDLIHISGQGMLYGGYARLTHTSTQANSSVMLRFDLQTGLEEKFVDLNTYNILYPGGNPITLTKYDNAGFIYGVVVPYGITFETYLTLRYREAHGSTPTVNFGMLYALT